MKSSVGNSASGRKTSLKQSHPGKGMTNGLGGRTNGMTNGLGGRTNGLTNGLGGRTNGMTNGLGGRTNGLTNGLGGRTNGLTNGLGGRTNGLTNGLGGLTNGMGGYGPRTLKRNNRAMAPLRLSIILVVIMILMVPVSFFLFQQNEATDLGMRADGDFSDWEEVTMFTDSNSYPIAELNIVNCALNTNEADSVFIYAQAGGNWMTAAQADSLMAFIDSDGDAATGYAVNGMGADFVADIQGWNGAVQVKQLGIFSGQDQLNWSAWTWRGIEAGMSGTEMEIGIPASMMTLQDAHKIQFMTMRGGSVAEVCDAAIGLGKGALTVKHIPGGQNGLVTSDALMTLELTASGAAVEVSSVEFTYSGIGAPTVTGIPATVTPGTPVTVTVTSAITGLANGTYVGLEVANIVSTGTSMVTGTALAAYAHTAPATVLVDGAFADWIGIPKTADADTMANPNIDIDSHAAVNSTAEAFFYLKGDGAGRMFGGSSVPQERSIPGPAGEPGEPGEPGPATAIPRLTGEDITRIYIDTESAGQLIHGIYADYMAEIKGIDGGITTAKLYSLPGNAFIADIAAANGAGELEAGIDLSDIGYTNSFGYVIESTDWAKVADVTQIGAFAGAVPGTRSGPEAPEMFAGTLTYISAPALSNTITINGAMGAGEWDGANTYDGVNYDLSVLVSGNYFYVAVAVTSDTAANGADGCILYFDPDHTGTGTPQTGDRKLMSFDTTGSPSNTGCVGDGSAWTVDILIDWSADSSLDGTFVVYEFMVGVEEVWGTTTPVSGQIAGFAVDIFDSDVPASYCWGSVAISDTDVSTWGELEIPEFNQVLLPILLLMGFVCLGRKSKQKNVQKEVEEPAEEEPEKPDEEEEEPEIQDDESDDDPDRSEPEFSDLPKIKHTLLIIGLIITMLGIFGVVGLRMGLVQLALGDSDPYPGIGSVEPMGHIVSMIPFIVGILIILYWGKKNNPAYAEIMAAKKEIADEEPFSENDEEPIIEDDIDVEDIEDEPDLEADIEDVKIDSAVPEEFTKKLEGLDEDQDLVSEIDLDEELEEEELPQLKKAPEETAATVKAQLAEEMRVERCQKMLSVAVVMPEDKEKLKQLIATGIEFKEFEGEVRKAIEKRKKKEAEKDVTSEEKASILEDDLVAELTELGDELGEDGDLENEIFKELDDLENL